MAIVSKAQSLKALATATVFLTVSSLAFAQTEDSLWDEVLDTQFSNGSPAPQPAAKKEPAAKPAATAQPSAPATAANLPSQPSTSQNLPAATSVPTAAVSLPAQVPTPKPRPAYNPSASQPAKKSTSSNITGCLNKAEDYRDPKNASLLKAMAEHLKVDDMSVITDRQFGSAQSGGMFKLEVPHMGEFLIISGGELMPAKRICLRKFPQNGKMTTKFEIVISTPDNGLGWIQLDGAIKNAEMTLANGQKVTGPTHFLRTLESGSHNLGGEIKEFDTRIAPTMMAGSPNPMSTPSAATAITAERPAPPVSQPSASRTAMGRARMISPSSGVR